MAAIRVRRLVTGSLAANCYVVAAAADAVVIDAGDNWERIAARLDADGVAVRAVLATHGHSDHLGAAAPLVGRYDAPFHLHPLDRGLLRRANFYRAFLSGEDPIAVPDVDVDLQDGATLRFGVLEVAVLHTPGHSPGSVCFLAGGELFSGDTLTADGLGRSDLPGSDPAALEASAARLAAELPPETWIRPGHGGRALLADALAAGGLAEPIR